MEVTKPWWRSKITLAGIVLALTAITDAATGFLTGNGVTADQIAAIQQAYPDAADQIRESVKGKNIFGAISAATGLLVSIWRVWFTKTAIG